MPAKELNLLHEIFILDASLKKPLDEKKMELITKKLTEKLLLSLKMERLGKLEIYPATDLRAPGWSFIQPITTSHISGHYFEKPGPKPHIHLDIYSCKKFNWRDALKIIDKNLHLEKWSAHLIKRDVDLKKSKSQVFSGKGCVAAREG